ncbi:MAG: hypothetical protein MHPSP_002908, partial [Paramarteilia canceri]
VFTLNDTNENRDILGVKIQCNSRSLNSIIPKTSNGKNYNVELSSNKELIFGYSCNPDYNIELSITIYVYPNNEESSEPKN